jgi:hypothetical protein
LRIGGSIYRDVAGSKTERANPKICFGLEEQLSDKLASNLLVFDPNHLENQ